MRKPLLAVIVAVLLGLGALETPARAWVDPTPPAKQPEQTHDTDELAGWVRPVQYVSGVLLVVGVCILIYLRTRKATPPA
jgi:hypothetical protein